MKIDARVEAKRLIKERDRCRTDKFYLAEQLGYDFQWETHAELFACGIKYDESVPWAEQDTIKDRMVLWSRGHYKTTWVVVEIVQVILNFPNIRIIIMQGNLTLTKTLLSQVRSHFTGQAEGSRLMELFPDFCDDNLGTNPTMTLTTPARTAKQLPQATVTVASPKSIKTGQHYDIGFFDDLMNESNYRNPKLMDKVKKDFTLAQALIDPGGYRFVTGTRYAFGDLYEQILRWQAASGKWFTSVKNCWTDDTQNAPDSLKVPRFPQYKKKNGQLGGFTTEILLQMQADDPANFACQYLNRPIALSDQIITEEEMRAAVVTREQCGVLSESMMVIDLATSSDEPMPERDDSVIQVGKVDTLGLGYLIDQRGGQWSPMELALNIIDVAMMHRPTRVMVEKSASGQVFADFLKLVAQQRRIFLPIDFIRVDNRPQAKDLRVKAWGGIVKKGKFKFLAGVPKFEKLIEQAVKFPRAKYRHDDYIDTSALLYQEMMRDLLAMPVRSAVKDPIISLVYAETHTPIDMLMADQFSSRREQLDLTGLE